MNAAVGATSLSADVQVVDDAGLPVTSLVAATFPPVTWSRAGANVDVSLALSDLALLSTPWTPGGLKERGNGVYRLDLPNAAFSASGEVKLRGEASGKHLLAPWIDVGTPVSVAAYATGFDPATLVLDVAASLHNVAGTVGAKINAAGGAADPLSSVVPGVYPSGTAGYVIGHLAGTQVITVSVVAQNGDISLVRDCDYYAADGRAITWTDDSAAFPNLTGATVLVTVYDRAFSVVATWAATCLNPGAAAQTVQLELSHAQTVALGSGPYPFKVVATLASTHAVPLLAGTVTVGNV